MFIMIRSTEKDNDVLAIFDENMLLNPDDLKEFGAENYSRAVSFGKSGIIIMSAHIVEIVDSKLDISDWVWEEITQAEFETYRDLHKFRVLTL